MVKISSLSDKTLDCSIILSTGDTLNVKAKRYGVSVSDQSQNIASMQKLQNGEMSEEEFIERTCNAIISLISSWDLMEDDDTMYPLTIEKLSQLPIYLLNEIAEKVMESLTFRQPKR